MTIELIDGIFIHLLLVSSLIIYLLLDGERSFQAYYKYASGKSMRVRSIRSFVIFFLIFIFKKSICAFFSYVLSNWQVSDTSKKKFQSLFGSLSDDS